MEQERKIAEDATKEQAIKIDTEKKAKAIASRKKDPAKKAIKKNGKRGNKSGFSSKHLASTSDQYLNSIPKVSINIGRFLYAKKIVIVKFFTCSDNN